MSGRVLIKGGTVLSLDRSVGNMLTGDVLVEDGAITEVGASLRSRNAEVIDAADTIVMPGFVDTHRHAWHALFRNIGGGRPAIAPADIGPHYQPDHVYAATYVALLGAIEAGITTVVDWADLPSDPAYVDASLQAHADAGIRSVCVAARAAWDAVPWDETQLREAASNRTGVTSRAFGARDPETATDDVTTREWSLARTVGLRIHAHVGMVAPSGGAVAGLHAAGLLGEDVTLVHCTNLDGADLDAIKSSGARVSVTPSTEMTGGVGAPPLQGLIDRGIRPGLGVGSEMEAPGDMFAQMRSANSVQHATLFDLKLAGKGGVPNLLTTRDVIRYGTVDGANAVGLGDVTGSIRPGARADIIVLRTDRPNIAPVNDPIGAVVWGMDTSNIDWVLVDGRVLVAEGALTADVAHARSLAAAARREIAAAAGLLAESGAESQ